VGGAEIITIIPARKMTMPIARNGVVMSINENIPRGAAAVVTGRGRS
jgi:hypothetical protein